MTTFAVELRRSAAAPDTCTSRSDSPSPQTASAVAQVRSTWATACAYAIVYGVAFIFLMGPAGNMLAGLGNATQAQSARFSMLLATALVVGVGAASLSFGLRRVSGTAFAAWAVLFAAIVAAGFAAAAAVVFGGFAPAIAWAAALGVLVPGALAGITARTTGPQLARRSRDLAAASLAAVSVVAVAVYLATGVASGTADIATIAGATVLP